MSIFIFRKLGGSRENPDFRFDAELSEARERSVQWTEFATEAQAKISDFGWSKPQLYDLEGIITALPLVGTPGIERLTSIGDTLDALVKARQVVTVVTRAWVKDLVLERVRESSGQGDGEANRVQIRLREVDRVEPATVKIAASRLAPRVRRKNMTTLKVGGRLVPITRTDLNALQNQAATTYRDTPVSVTTKLRSTELLAQPTQLP
jgi:hypothetical protein